MTDRTEQSIIESHIDAEEIFYNDVKATEWTKEQIANMLFLY